jgi:alpha-beta hydrolase superfamily lysophospholipase
MPEIGGGLPASVRERARVERFGDVPALVVHPGFAADGGMHPGIEGGRAPVLLWMHGRTANKELDPGRFLRLVRAGIATVSVDLPGHGARLDEALQQPERTLEFVEQMAGEVDRVVEAMLATGWFDDTRLAIGGMSAGGMAALIRLCSAHPFRAACVECTTGSFAWQRNRAMYDAQRAARLDPIQHLAGWRAIPLLVLHNELDAWVAIDGQREFVEALRARGLAGDVEMHAYGETGAPYEHSGFGRFASDAKDRQTNFLVKHLRGAGG